MEAELEEEEVLMVFLIQEMHNPKSDWAPYFKILPQEYAPQLVPFLKTQKGGSCIKRRVHSLNDPNYHVPPVPPRSYSTLTP